MKHFLFTLPLFALMLLSACQGPETAPLMPPEDIEVIEDSESSVPLEDFNADEDESTEVEPDEAVTDENVDSPEPETKSEVVEPIADLELEVEAPDESKGWIEGSVSYPSEELPDDLEVCAGQIKEGNEMYCTNEWIKDDKYEYGFGYKLALPPGTYQVMAEPSGGGLTGLYSEFVLCGGTVDCSDHTPIDVLVEVGASVEGVDPGDWYH